MKLDYHKKLIEYKRTELADNIYLEEGNCLIQNSIMIFPTQRPSEFLRPQADYFHYHIPEKLE